MAKVSASVAVDLVNLGEDAISFYNPDTSQVIKADAKQVSLIDANGEKQAYAGKFVFDKQGELDYSSSYLTSFTQYAGGKSAYAVSGFKLGGDDYQAFADQTDSLGLIQFVLAGDDTITGSQFDDVLCGWGGSNKLNGGLGADTLQSYVRSQAIDTLTGGKQGDTFLIHVRDADYEDGLATGAGRVVIADFKASEGDVVQLIFEDGDLNELPLSFDDTAFTGEQGSVIFTPGKKDGLLSVDIDGDQQADVLMTLKGFKGDLDPQFLILGSS